MDIIMPQLGETVEEGTISVWYKKAGDTVNADDPLFEVETDKVTTEVPALSAGTLTEVLVEAGETVKVGTKLAVLDTGEQVSAAKDPSARKKAKTTGGESQTTPKKDKAAKVKKTGKSAKVDTEALSPVVRRLLDEHNLNADEIEGTGRDGRIQRKDVLDHLEKRKSGKAAPSPATGEDEVQPFNRRRKQIAEHMVRSKATSAHVLQAVEVDFGRLERVRTQHKEAWKQREGYSLTYLPFIARAVCLTLPEYPRVNATIEGEDLVVHHRINLGIAVDLGEEGLMVPVIKDAGGMRVTELARAIRDLAEKARQDKISPDDIAGGTYTLTNNGAYGTLITAPIINQPQVAILSSDGVRKRPVVVEGESGDAIAIRPVGVLAQSFDHRAIDGAYSGAFLNRLRSVIEDTDWEAEIG